MNRFTLACAWIGVFLAGCGSSAADQTKAPSGITSEGPVAGTTAPTATPTSAATPTMTATPSAAPTPVTGTRLVPLGYRVLGAAFDVDHFHDRALDIDCTASTWTNGQAACLPNVAGTPVYADATCSTQRLMFEGPVSTKYALIYGENQEVPSGVMLGSGHDQAVVYDLTESGDCEEVPNHLVSAIAYDFELVSEDTFVTGTATLNAIGSTVDTTTVTFSDGTVTAPIRPFSIPSALDEVIHGGDRLAISSRVTETGDVAWSNLYDRNLEAECVPMTLSDGRKYCVSTRAYFAIGAAYRDAACAQPVYTKEMAGVTQAPGNPLFLESPEGVVSAFVVAAQHDDAPVYRRNAAGACAVWTSMTSWDLTPRASDGLAEVVETPL